MPGARVVAAYKGGSPDIEASASRLEKFTADLRDTWRIELVAPIDELVRRVDAVILLSVDGRVHLAQARPVHRRAQAALHRQAVHRQRAGRHGAREAGTGEPARPSSAPRPCGSTTRCSESSATREWRRCWARITWGPAPVEPHHPDLFWYGIHAVEMLYTFMGPGCERVTRTHTAGADVVTGHWKDGRIGVVRGIREGASSYGQVVFGRKAIVSTPPADAAAAPVKRSSYHGLLVAIVEFFRTRTSPVPLDETLEIMAFMEAADLSKVRVGAPVELTEVLPPAEGRREGR